MDEGPNVADPEYLEIKVRKAEARELAQRLEVLNREDFQKEQILKAQKKLEGKRTINNERLTHKERRSNAIIKPKVRELVRTNVLEKGMNQKEAVSTFDVSRCQVQRIIKEDPNLVKVNKKHPSKFLDEALANLLMFVNQQSTSTLKEMANFLKNEHDMTVTTQAISNILKDVDVTWKQVTNIPTSWNWPNLLEQWANFVNCCGLDLDQKLVYVDEAGFDLHSSRAKGYSASGILAVLSLVPKVKQITLIGVLSKNSYEYHKLINTDGTQAKGVGSNDFCLFLSSLASQLPQDSIIIMDNAPIHCGRQFDNLQ